MNLAALLSSKNFQQFSNATKVHAISLLKLNTFMQTNQEETCWNHHRNQTLRFAAGLKQKIRIDRPEREKTQQGSRA